MKHTDQFNKIHTLNKAAAMFQNMDPSQLEEFQGGTASQFDQNSWLDKNKMFRKQQGHDDWADNDAARAMGSGFDYSSAAAPPQEAAAPEAPLYGSQGASSPEEMMQGMQEQAPAYGHAGVSSPEEMMAGMQEEPAPMYGNAGSAAPPDPSAPAPPMYGNSGGGLPPNISIQEPTEQMAAQPPETQPAPQAPPQGGGIFDALKYRMLQSPTAASMLGMPPKGASTNRQMTHREKFEKSAGIASVLGGVAKKVGGKLWGAAKPMAQKVYQGANPVTQKSMRAAGANMKTVGQSAQKLGDDVVSAGRSAKNMVGNMAGDAARSGKQGWNNLAPKTQGLITGGATGAALTPLMRSAGNTLNGSTSPGPAGTAPVGSKPSTPGNIPRKTVVSPDFHGGTSAPVIRDSKSASHSEEFAKIALSVKAMKATGQKALDWAGDFGKKHLGGLGEKAKQLEGDVSGGAGRFLRNPTGAEGKALSKPVTAMQEAGDKALGRAAIGGTALTGTGYGMGRSGGYSKGHGEGGMDALNQVADSLQDSYGGWKGRLNALLGGAKPGHEALLEIARQYQ